MRVDIKERVAKKLRVHGSPRPRQRHWAEWSWQNDLIHKCSGLRIAPLEDTGREIGPREDNVVVIHRNADVVSRLNQSRGGGKRILDDLRCDLIMSALSGQFTKKLLQH